MGALKRGDSTSTAISAWDYRERDKIAIDLNDVSRENDGHGLQFADLWESMARHFRRVCAGWWELTISNYLDRKTLCRNRLKHSVAIYID